MSPTVTGVAPSCWFKSPMGQNGSVWTIAGSTRCPNSMSIQLVLRTGAETRTRLQDG